MRLLYKFLTTLTILIILSRCLSASIILLLVVLVILILCLSDLRVFQVKKIIRADLKVRNRKQKVSSYYDCTNCSNSASDMQNSKVKVTLSPVSNGMNGISKRIGYSISSTPLPSSTPHAQNMLFYSPQISPHRHSPRYFLSNASLTTSPVTTVKPVRPVQKSSGPLLASTRFNVNLGTYTDSKSPGLSSRIVQYDNETKEKYTPTHQAKYGSPGVYPIVHFFKKEITIISPKAKRVTVRLASPDTHFYNTSKYSTSLSSEALSEIRNGRDNDMRQTTTGTRNVLDALKEISRKRIHTSTGFEPNQEATKRQRVDCMSSAYENNKRAREESPIQEPNTTTNLSQSAPKKICVVDVLAASYTSSNLLREQLEKGLKRKTELDESQKQNKQKEIKLINAETQTQNTEEVLEKTELTKKLQEEFTSKLNELETPNSEKKEVQSSPTRFLNIFNDKRLEINRKNKLATLLSAMTGESPKLIPHNSPPQQKEDRKLISILSPQNKPKHDKHVSFNLPPDKNDSEKKDEVAIEKVKDDTSVSDEAKLNFSSSNEDKKITSLSLDVTSTVNSSTQVTNSLPSMVISSASIGGFAFKPKETTDAAVISTNANSSLKPVSLNTNSSDAITVTNVTSTSTPKGGFKFDLSKTKSTVTTASVKTSSFPFGVTPNQNFSPVSQGVSKPLFDGEVKTSEAFNFGSKSFTGTPILGGQIILPLSLPANMGNAAVMSTPVTSLTSGNSSAVTSVMASTSPFNFTNSVNFGSRNSFPGTFSTSTVTLGLNTSSTSTVSFPMITSPSKFVITTATSVFGGTPNSTVMFSNMSSSPPAFSASKVLSLNFGTIPTPAPNFGTISTTPSNFGTVSTTASNFGTVSTTAPNFGAVPTTVSNFGNTVTTAISTLALNFGSISTSVPSFGATSTITTKFNTISSTSTPIFATTSNISTPMFGTTTSSIPIFGTTTSTSAPMFGTTTSTSTPMLGTTSSTSTPMFGTTTSTSAPMFGTTSSITTSIFGGTSTSPPVFGTISAFNSVPNYAAGFNSSSNFNVSSFAAPNSFTTTVTTTTAPFVSTTSAPIFTNSSFGTPATSFSGSDTMFGLPTSSGGTVKPTFGFPPSPSLTFKTSVPSFGTNQITSTALDFRTNPTVTSVPSFGMNSAPAFGANAVTSAPTFGTSMPSFASNLTSTPMFATNSTNSMPFGSNSNIPNIIPGFGTNVVNTPAINSTAFNTPVTTASSGFGATPKPFSFGSNTAFVSNSTTSFNFTPTTSTSIFNTPKTTPSFTSNFGPSSNQSVNFGSTTLQQTSSPPNPFGPAPNAFPFQSHNTQFGNKNTAFNNSFNSSGAFGNAASPNQMFGSGDPQNVKFSSPSTGFQFNNTSSFDAKNANNTSTGQTGLFTFGSNNVSNPLPSAGVFTFGTADTKPNFNFSAGSNLPTPAFGTTLPNTSFGNSFAPSSAGMFSIGSGSSTTTNRSRMQFKVEHW